MEKKDSDSDKSETYRQRIWPRTPFWWPRRSMRRGSACRPRHSPAEARRTTSWPVWSHTPTDLFESKQRKFVLKTSTVAYEKW